MKIGRVVASGGGGGGVKERDVNDYPLTLSL